MPGYTSDCKEGEKCSNFINLSTHMNNSNKLNLIIFLLLIIILMNLYNCMKK